MLRDIYPVVELGSELVTLLTKPQAPVGRYMIDQQLNRKKDPKLAAQISDTLIWLHLVGRVSRNMIDNEVKFWTSDKTFDGIENAAPNYDKYQVNVCNRKTVEQVPVAPVEPPVVKTPIDFSDVLIGDTELADPELESESESADEEPQLKPGTVTTDPGNGSDDDAPVVKKSTDRAISDWAAEQQAPWTARRCFAEIVGQAAVKAMRLSTMVRRNQIQKGWYNASEYYLAVGREYPGFKPMAMVMALPKEAKVKKPKLDPSPVLTSVQTPKPVVPNFTVAGTAHLEQPKPVGLLGRTDVPYQEADLVDDRPSSVPTLEEMSGVYKGSITTIDFNTDSVEFIISSLGTFTIKGVNVQVLIGPKTMNKLLEFSQRFNLMDQYGNHE